MREPFPNDDTPNLEWLKKGPLSSYLEWPARLEWLQPKNVEKHSFGRFRTSYGHALDSTD